jgi:TPR repeat protein
MFTMKRDFYILLNNENGKKLTEHCINCEVLVEHVVCESCYEFFERTQEKNEDIDFKLASHVFQKGLLRKDKKLSILGIKLWHLNGKHGCSQSILNIAILFLNGFCLVQNIPKALEYLKIADRMGNSIATFFIAHLYFYGIGVEENRQKAYDTWASAAFQGHKHSEDILLGNDYPLTSLTLPSLILPSIIL